MASVDRIQGLSGGLAVKAPCRVATTANITLSGLQTIDGVTVVADDRVLVKDQSTASQNGIYVASSSSWSRALDFDGTNDVVQGTQVVVAAGTVGAGSTFRISTANPITIGTTSIAFATATTAGDVAAAAASAAAASSSASAASTSAGNASTFADAASASASAAQTAETNAETAETNAETAETNAEAAATLASEWATLTSGQVAATDYSAKAYAIGGTGVTGAAGSAKEWAIETSGSVDGGSGYSAKQWATKLTTTVDGSSYSAKQYALDAAASAATAAGFTNGDYGLVTDAVGTTSDYGTIP